MMHCAHNFRHKLFRFCLARPFLFSEIEASKGKSKGFDKLPGRLAVIGEGVRDPAAFGVHFLYSPSVIVIGKTPRANCKIEVASLIRLRKIGIAFIKAPHEIRRDIARLFQMVTEPNKSGIYVGFGYS